MANAAGADYVDHSAECGAPGQPAVLHLRRDELSRGLHYAPCDVVLTDALSHQPTTIVADGKIKVTGSTSELGPAYVDGLQLFSDSTSKNAIKIAGNWADVDGVVYAPRGQVTVAGEGHEFRCAVVASRVAIKGAKHTFTGDADCGSVPPGNTPPIAIDDAYSVDEDNTLTIVAPGVLGNDTDADGDPLTAVLVDDVANGTLTLDGARRVHVCPRRRLRRRRHLHLRRQRRHRRLQHRHRHHHRQPRQRPTGRRRERPLQRGSRARRSRSTGPARPTPTAPSTPTTGTSATAAPAPVSHRPTPTPKPARSP